MAAEVAEAIAAEEVLFVQAGTGTGKSVGYLVRGSGVQSGATAVIATATPAPQRQLVARDPPAVTAG